MNTRKSLEKAIDLQHYPFCINSFPTAEKCYAQKGIGNVGRKEYANNTKLHRYRTFQEFTNFLT